MGCRACCSYCWPADLYYFIHVVLLITKEGKLLLHKQSDLLNVSFTNWWLVFREPTLKRLMNSLPTMFPKKKKKRKQLLKLQSVPKASWILMSRRWSPNRKKQLVNQKTLNQKKRQSDRQASQLLESANLERSNSKESGRNVGECFVHKANQSTHH